MKTGCCLSERIRGTVGPKSKAECEVRDLEACLGGRLCRATLLPRQEACLQLSVEERPRFGEREGCGRGLDQRGLDYYN